MVGVITSRTRFFLSPFELWREEIPLASLRRIVPVDFSRGVLGTVRLETASYCLEPMGEA